MAIQIVNYQKQNKESALDKVLKGVQVAQGLIGSAINVNDLVEKRTSGALDQQRLEEQRKQFSASQAMDQAKLDENKRQFDVTNAREKEKKVKEKAGTIVQGFESVAGAAPSAQDAKDVKEASQYRDVINTSLKKLKGLVQEHGTELFGDASAEMGQLVTDARLNAKELYKLGVLSGPDMALIEKVIPDPTSLAAAALPNSRYVNGIENATKIINQRLENIATTRGYKELPRKPDSIDEGKEIPKKDSSSPPPWKMRW